jgi:hypothetical protein
METDEIDSHWINTPGQFDALLGFGFKRDNRERLVFGETVVDQFLYRNNIAGSAAQTPREGRRSRRRKRPAVHGLVRITGNIRI